ASAPAGCRPEPVAVQHPAVTVSPSASTPVVGANDVAPAATTRPAAQSCSEDPPDPDAKPPPRDEGYTHVVPDHDVAIGRVVGRAGAGVWRDPEGRLRVCTVARRVALDGVEVAAGAYTLFHESGRPYQTTLARHQALTTAVGLVVPCVDFVVL